MEIWDAYHENGEKAGFDLVRGQDVPTGVYHIVCEVLVKHEDGDFLLMQRDLNKEDYAGKYESTAGGSALKGETPDDCIKRELFEETGISANDFKLIGVSNGSRSIFHSYICKTNCKKDSIVLQKGETIAYKWVCKDEFLKYTVSENCIPPQIKRFKSYIELI